MNKLSRFRAQTILNNLDATIALINEAIQNPPSVDTYLGAAILTIGEVKRDFLDVAVTEVEVEPAEKELAA